MKKLYYLTKWRVSAFKLFVKSKYQLLRYGYEFKDAWNLDVATAKWILPRLKHLRNNTQSHPNDLTFEEWQKTLDQMIYAFEFVLNEEDILEKCYPDDFDYGFNRGEDNKMIFKDDRKPDYTYYNKCREKYNLGIQKFSSYFQNLWD